MSVTCVKCDGSVSPETVWCSDCIAALEAERDAAALIIKKHKNSRDRWKAECDAANAREAKLREDVLGWRIINTDTLGAAFPACTPARARLLDLDRILATTPQLASDDDRPEEPSAGDGGYAP